MEKNFPFVLARKVKRDSDPTEEYGLEALLEYNLLDDNLFEDELLEDALSNLYRRLDVMRDKQIPACSSCADLDFNTENLLPVGQRSPGRQDFSCLLCPLLAHLSEGLLDPAEFLSSPKVARKIKEFAVLPRGSHPWRNENTHDCRQSQIDSGSGTNRYTPQEIKEFIRVNVCFVHGRDRHDRFRLIDTYKADFNVISEWLKNCETHTPSCGYDGPILYGARIIDCETRQIVTAEQSWKYLALSYVWGTEAENWSITAFNGFLPQQAPAVIEDAILVTKRLGFRYLWVDRYCIPQDDPDEKLRQIQSMDQIYSNAFLTIIAAAGVDPSYGLPGVNQRTRTAQLYEEIGEYILFSKIPHPRKAIAASHWASRAWTYQEDILSRRHLVFTEKLVYYECQLSSFSEDRKDEYHKNEYRKTVRFPTDTESTQDILKHLSDYTSRNLTVESDILDGMAGVFQVYQQNNWALQYWGVPVLSKRQIYLLSLDSWYWGFIKELPTSWNHTMSLVVGLFWDGRMTHRRAGFPSWSWCGWVGRTSSYPPGVVVPFRLPFGNVAISVETEDGALREWESFVNSGGLKTEALHMSPFLHVSAWTSTVLIDHFPNGIAGQRGLSKDYFFVRICNFRGESAGTGGGYSPIKFTRTDHKENYRAAGEIQGEHRVLECILFEEVKKTNHFKLDANDDGRKGPQALLVAKGGDYYERVGHFVFAPADLVWVDSPPHGSEEIYTWELETSLIEKTVKLG